MADGSDSPRDLVAYQRLLEEGYECAFGSRFMPGSAVHDYPRTKLIMNRIVNWGIRLLFRHGYNDTTNAFKAYRREVIENAQPFLSHHFNLTVELPLKAVVRGYSYGIVPISWTNRTSGTLEAEAERDGQPLPVHRPLRLPRGPPEPRRLPEEGNVDRARDGGPARAAGRLGGARRGDALLRRADPPRRPRAGLRDRRTLLLRAGRQRQRAADPLRALRAPAIWLPRSTATCRSAGASSTSWSSRRSAPTTRSSC